MGDPLIRSPKNITDITHCAFRIGIEGNEEKSIQDILDSAPSNYRSQEQSVNSIRLVFEDLEAMRAYGIGYAISLIRSLKIKESDDADIICSPRQEYCIGCGFNKPEGCNISLELYRMVSVNGLGRRY